MEVEIIPPTIEKSSTILSNILNFFFHFAFLHLTDCAQSKILGAFFLAEEQKKPKKNWESAKNRNKDILQKKVFITSSKLQQRNF